MPSKIEIDQLLIKDSHLKDYESLYIFSDFNSKMKDEKFKEYFPYIKTDVIQMKGVKITSNKQLELSENAFLFENMKIEMDPQ